MSMNFHQRCEAVEAILRSAITDARQRQDVVNTAMSTRIHDLEEQLGDAHQQLLIQSSEFADRERDLTDRLLAFANPAATHAANRLQTPAASPPQLPRSGPRPVAAHGSRAPLTPAGSGFNPSPDVRRANAIERARQAQALKQAEEVAAAAATDAAPLPSIEEHLAEDAALNLRTSVNRE